VTTLGHTLGAGAGSVQTVVERFTGAPEEWDEFVTRTRGATFFHLTGWNQVIHEMFRFAPHYLVARREGQIVGVLPMFALPCRRKRSCLLSLPFAVEGGVCASDLEAQHALDSAAIALGNACGAMYVELRDGLESSGFHMCEGLYCRFRRPLLATEAENLAAIPRKQRRMIRVGQEHGLESRIGNTHLAAFHDLYARTVRRLGTPVFPLCYFQRLVDQFPDDSMLLTVWDDNTPVAGVLSFFFRDTVLPYYAGSRRQYFRHAVNDFMYWELMRAAHARGTRVFDFGRSKKGTGAFDFKRHWGFEPEPLRYRVHTPGGDAIPDRTSNQAAVRLLRTVWSHLPLGVTKLLGPYFVRRYGPYYT
jgi:FemAB-related protein (PEP-CTERM system-associated)